ncbi:MULTISPECIES: hypothetical protein [Blautia]|uniref:hypothetical protein n=2 Tax=Blautia TaxID=572511 RepID=UPI002595D34F|nr:hypothetical protein [uncultured Blautia sp.]
MGGGMQCGRGIRCGVGEGGDIQGAKRSAVRKLTCSQSLNSSAMASSLSVWGRWIFRTLH